MVQYLSQSNIHPVQEWPWFWRKVRFCGDVRVHIIIDDKLVIVGSLHSCSQHFTRFPTLEKTTFRQCFILSSLMSWRPSQVSPFLVAAHSTSSEVFDFQIWFSPDLLMQSKQARMDPSRCIVRPNSSSALILLWLFFHLHLLVFFSTSHWRCNWSWND